MSPITQNAAVAVAYADVGGFPPGSAVASIAVAAVAANAANNPPPQSVPPGTAEVTFPNLQPDTYTISAQALSAGGQGFGKPVSTTITIVAPATISLSLPASLSASQP